MKAVAGLLALALSLPITASSVFARTIPAATALARRAPVITVEDLGTFRGYLTVPVAVNNRRELAVNAWDNLGSQAAVYWSARTGFVEVTPGFISVSFDINDHGQLVGIYSHPDDNSTRGFVWSARHGELVDLGTFAPLDINNRGVMLGQCWSDATSELPYYCLYEDGEFYRLPVNGGRPQHLNDRGVIVGSLSTDTERLRAFTWSRRSGLALLELPTGMTGTFGCAINNKGTVLGWTTDDLDFGADAATLWRRSGAQVETSLLPFVNVRCVLNDKEWMLEQNHRLWIGQWGPVFLPAPPRLDPGWEPVAINLNDRGDIVGWGIVNGETHTILWTVQH